jgi:hypothetical protein
MSWRFRVLSLFVRYLDLCLTGFLCNGVLSLFVFLVNLGIIISHQNSKTENVNVKWCFRFERNGAVWFTVILDDDDDDSRLPILFVHEIENRSALTKMSLNFTRFLDQSDEAVL